jgi:transposase
MTPNVRSNINYYSLFWLSDAAWKTLEPHLPHGKPGKSRVGDRTVISGILDVLKTGCVENRMPLARRSASLWATDDHLQPRQSLVPAPYLAAHFRENGGRRSSS